MAAIIADPVQFNKKLHKMFNAGGKAGAAARQTRNLIRELAGSDNLDQKLSSKLTRNGEARMENCCKFQLVSGYRLVMVKKDGFFVFLFLGTHDETDNWIKNNAGCTVDLSKGEVVPCPGEPVQTEWGVRYRNGEQCVDDYEKPLHEVLDQSILRDIFRGLCSPPDKASEGCPPGSPANSCQVIRH